MVLHIKFPVSWLIAAVLPALILASLSGCNIHESANPDKPGEAPKVAKTPPATPATPATPAPPATPAVAVKIPQSEDELFKAVEKGDTDAVRAALDAHPLWLESRKHHWGITPICVAAWKGHTDIVALCIDRGADTNAHHDKWKWRPLHEAASGGHVESIKLLLANGAELEARNHDDRTALMMALEEGHSKAVAELLAAGARTDMIDAEGWTMLHIVAFSGNVEMVQSLLDNGLDLNAKTRLGRTAVFWTTSAKMLDTLKDAGADIHDRCKRGRTPLHIAAMFGHDEVVKRLIELGVDINAKDKSGKTPLDLAMAEQTRQILSDNGATVGNAQSSTTPAITRTNARGTIFLNGEPVFPFAVWQQPKRLFEYNRSLGITWVAYPPGGGLTPETSTAAYVKAAKKKDLGVIMHHNPGLDKLESVYGWAGDSGGYRGLRHYEKLRSVSPLRMICSNVGSHGLLNGEDDAFYKPYFKIIDCVIPHVWPEMLDDKPRNLRLVGDLTDHIRKLCKDRPGGEIAIIPDINPHEWRSHSGPELAPAPTKEELRFQVWLAIIHGADGICLFPISFNPFVFNQIPAGIAEYLPTLTAEVKSFEKVLAAEQSQVQFTVTAAEDGAILDTTTRHYDGYDYIFVLNGTENAATITFACDDIDKNLAMTNALTGKEIKTTESTHSEQLKGLDLRIWKLGPHAK